MALDDFVQQHSGDAGCGSKEENELDAITHHSVSSFLWFDDHAHRRARRDYPIAAKSHSDLAK